MDVRKYFQNINKDILMKILRKKVKDKKVENLLEKIVYSNPGKKAFRLETIHHKYSQTIYLNEVDQYIKQKLKVKYYFRYMDDSICLLKLKRQQMQSYERLEHFKGKIRLRIK